jgi:hypothetical protein
MASSFLGSMRYKGRKATVGDNPSIVEILRRTPSTADSCIDSYARLTEDCAGGGDLRIFVACDNAGATLTTMLLTSTL